MIMINANHLMKIFHENSYLGISSTLNTTSMQIISPYLIKKSTFNKHAVIKNNHNQYIRTKILEVITDDKYQIKQQSFYVLGISTFKNPSFLMEVPRKTA
jgi:hypothetical protein